ncbi:hypothetical protein E5Q_04766 [Mixia osmundae IAM 14324]|uniref:Nuclear transport factor 2 n=1 Tax=Mixia osmundae (strain CBS 9802 / IAM 14324 / JCM 22182 / KY 12970) TaxID=764103 RepID=G7E5H4_MIXOS|nr:hypothetical protein E5Q_04766 [Mixia osmundae IAM 14324]
MSFAEVAQQFVTYYYQVFDADRSNLSALYRDQSMLTFESASTQGTTAITEKLKGLPFQKVQHNVSTLDAQPTGPDHRSILVQVTGQLVVDDGANPLQFSQAFVLNPEGSSYYVYNDVFRLVYVRAPDPSHRREADRGAFTGLEHQTSPATGCAVCACRDHADHAPSCHALRVSSPQRATLRNSCLGAGMQSLLCHADVDERDLHPRLLHRQRRVTSRRPASPDYVPARNQKSDPQSSNEYTQRSGGPSRMASIAARRAARQALPSEEEDELTSPWTQAGADTPSESSSAASSDFEAVDLVDSSSETELGTRIGYRGRVISQRIPSRSEAEHGNVQSLMLSAYPALSPTSQTQARSSSHASARSSSSSRAADDDSSAFDSDTNSTLLGASGWARADRFASSLAERTSVDRAEPAFRGEAQAEQGRLEEVIKASLSTLLTMSKSTTVSSPLHEQPSDDNAERSTLFAHDDLPMRPWLIRNDTLRSSAIVPSQSLRSSAITPRPSTGTNGDVATPHTGSQALPLVDDTTSPSSSDSGQERRRNPSRTRQARPRQRASRTGKQQPSHPPHEPAAKWSDWLKPSIWIEAVSCISWQAIGVISLVFVTGSIVGFSLSRSFVHSHAKLSVLNRLVI